MDIKIIFTDGTYTILESGSMKDIEYLLQDDERVVKLIKEIKGNK